MFKELIDLQRNSKATCVIVKNEEYNQLSPVISMHAHASDKYLLSLKEPKFASIINKTCENKKLCYFVIKEIDSISTQMQDKFVGLVKDRELNGYILPNNCIIVFTVKDKLSLKKISPNLYNFAVVAF